MSFRPGSAAPAFLEKHPHSHSSVLTLPCTVKQRLGTNLKSKYCMTRRRGTMRRRTLKRIGARGRKRTAAMGTDATPEERKVGKFQFSLRKLMLWMAVCAVYTSVVIAAEPANLEWLAMSCWPALVLGLRVVVNPWLACHCSAIGAGLLLVLGLFFPSPPTNVFEIEYTFATGCGIGYLVFVVIEIVRQLVNRADKLMRRRTED